MILNRFIIIILIISSSNIYCQNSNEKNSMNIKITDIETTSEFYAYRYVEYDRCVADTLKLLEKKMKQQNNSLELDKYYFIKYKSESIISKPSYNNNFIQDNIRLSDDFGFRLIVDYHKIDSLNINESIFTYDCLSYFKYENFEIFLQKFINDKNFRYSRINFNNSRILSKKQIKKWKKAENLLINYKTNKFKRDKVYYDDYKNMYFRIYKGSFLETTMLYISFTFRLDENNQWYLFNFNNLNDTW